MISWIHADKPIAQFIFAHGAGQGLESEFMQTVANLLAEQQISVGLFDFEYMQKAKALGKRQPPQRAPKLIDYYRHVLTSVQPDLPLFIGGKSMGGRMASMLATDPVCHGVIAFGYPFHPPGKSDKLRIEHLPELAVPMLVIQGERDTFGNVTEVPHYELGPRVSLAWINDGDHSLVPRKATGLSALDNWRSAAVCARSFINKVLG
jgi:predicted alpha/beta-hydrolase family hydrolase